MKCKGILLLITIITITTVIITSGCGEKSSVPTVPTEPTKPTEPIKPTEPTPTGEPSLLVSSFDVAKNLGTHVATASVEVYNAGDATAKNFDVLIKWEYITSAPELKYSGSNIIVQSGYLVPGKRMTYTHPGAFVINYSGNYRVSAIIVPDNKVPNKKITAASKEVYLSS